VLVTHPVLWRADLPPHLEALLYFAETPTSSSGGARGYFSAAALARGMRAFNEETLAICGDRGLACFDLAAVLPADTTVFYDDIHFNEAGARAVASVLAPFLAEALRVR
jgi:hypothetical protein